MKQAAKMNMLVEVNQVQKDNVIRSRYYRDRQQKGGCQLGGEKRADGCAKRVWFGFES